MIIEDYRAKGEDIDVDVVAYGPACICAGRTIAGTGRIKNLKSLPFQADSIFGCNVTKVGMEKKEGHPLHVRPTLSWFSAGVVR